MKVKATAMGYYNHKRRRTGDVFELVPVKHSNGVLLSPEQQFSSKWMEKIQDDAVETPAIRPEINKDNLDYAMDNIATHNTSIPDSLKNKPEENKNEQKKEESQKESSGDSQVI